MGLAHGQRDNTAGEGQIRIFLQFFVASDGEEKENPLFRLLLTEFTEYSQPPNGKNETKPGLCDTFGRFFCASFYKNFFCLFGKGREKLQKLLTFCEDSRII
ncbi:MAG: hypothetical protein PUC32_00190 [Oscillospiraceae bacterium]|nr:hypothetical protein [Oscillospiraceae bacterium]